MFFKPKKLLFSLIKYFEQISYKKSYLTILFLYENAYKRLIYENPTETVFSNNTWHPVKIPRNNTIHTPDATDRPAIVSQPVPFSSSYPPFR